MRVGERIKNIREAEGLTQNGLAEMAGISQSHLRRVELGQAKITTDLLQMICDACNISIIDFFDVDRGVDELSVAISKLTPKQKTKLLDFINSL